MQSIKQLSFLLFVPLFFCSSFAQESLNMSLLGRWDDPSLVEHNGIRYNDIWGYVDCQGREYAIVGSARFIHFFDVTDPAQPQEVATFPGSANSIWRDFKTFGDRAYAVADQGTDGLLIFDLSQLPDTVLLTNQLNGQFTRSHNIFIDEAQGRLYAVGTNTSAHAVVYDLNDDPDNPTLLFASPLPGGYIHDIYVRSHVAYASSGFNGLWVYDFSNASSPVVLGNLNSYPESGYNHASWLSAGGQRLVFADETHGRSLKLADVSDPSDISILGLFKSNLLGPDQPNSIAHNPFIRDQYAIISYYHDGIQIFDLSNPDDIQQVAYYDTYPDNTNYAGYEGAWGVYPFLPSGNIIASDITYGLFILSADEITFSPIQTPTDPDLELSPADDAALCEGEVLQLQLDGAAEAIQWWHNGQVLENPTASFVTGEAGAYWVTGANGHCTAGTDTLQVTVNLLPETGIQAGENMICAGETTTLSGSAGADLYRWFLDDGLIAEEPGGILTVSQAGTYHFEAVLGDCSAISEDLAIEVLPLPDVGYEVSKQTFCEGEFATITTNGNADLYRWFLDGELIAEGPEGQLEVTSGGIYQFDAVLEGCYAFAEPTLIEVYPLPEAPVISLEDGWLVASPAASYQWYLNGNVLADATQQNLLPAESGLYTVAISDENGCSAVSEPFEVAVTTTREDFKPTTGKLYPNPTRDRLQIEWPEVMEGLIITDSFGRIWKRIKTQEKSITLELDDLPAGVYWLQILSEGRTRSHRLLKM